MQKILLFSDAEKVKEYLCPKAVRILAQKDAESYIGISDFDVIVFDVSFLPENSRIAIYFDSENLFFFCENMQTAQLTGKIISEQTKDEEISNEDMLFYFFMSLIRIDSRVLSKYEALITDSDRAKLLSDDNFRQKRMMQYRRELWQLRRKYDQTGVILAQLISNSNSLLGERGVKYMTILDSGIDKLLSEISALREYIAQMQDEYQSILDYRLNSLMKVFTVVTSVFLPLTLIAGWYGMNFDIPAFSSPYGYPVVTGVSILIVVVLLAVFKRKKWI